MRLIRRKDAVGFLVLKVIILLPAALLLVSCGGTETGGLPDDDDNEIPGPGNVVDPEPEQIDYAALGVNEAGQIMVLMYHQIAESEDEWVRTPQNFRKDLETLYAAGYRLVSMNDLLDGKIDLPAGTTPVVLTFDDGTIGQFRYLEDGKELIIDSDCAVGILEQFYAEHPDFGLAATFYLFYAGTPFGQYEFVQQKLAYLEERGFEIGSHTYSHPSLRSISPEAARKELADQVRQTQQYLPGYRVRSLALPYGAHPDDKSYIIAGSHDGVSYHHEGILLVGSNPAPSPFSARFDGAAIPRIRASEMLTDGAGMYDWLQRFAENPLNRYISDGDPDTVAVPEELKDQVDQAKLAGRRLVIY
ncbi:MAG: polysaccharide deacetylase family protein [Bacillota bacterium]